MEAGENGGILGVAVPSAESGGSAGCPMYLRGLAKQRCLSRALKVRVDQALALAHGATPRFVASARSIRLPQHEPMFTILRTRNINVATVQAVDAFTAVRWVSLRWKASEKGAQAVPEYRVRLPTRATLRLVKRTPLPSMNHVHQRPVRESTYVVTRTEDHRKAVRVRHTLQSRRPRNQFV